MDRLRKKPAEVGMEPYNHSIVIIQSSGMGKSRLVDSIAERKFCFPFNIRGPLGNDQYGSVLVIFAIYILSYIPSIPAIRFRSLFLLPGSSIPTPG